MLLLSSSSLVRVVHRIDASSLKPLPSPFHRHVHSHCLPPARRLQRLPPPPATGASDADTFTEHSGYIFKLLDSETDSLVEYNPANIASLYRKKPLVLLRRCVQIATTLGRWFALRYIDALMERSNRMFKVRAAELREILAELGPAYIKIAQAISSRPDLIPPSYLEELSLLQDRIAPFSTFVAFNTIEQDLGLPIDEIFTEISPEPVAAASLGQVYQGRLRRNGHIVAVKVQRPGVQASISLDILILRFLAGLIRKAGKLNTDLQAVVDEWASSLYRVNHIECRRWTTFKKQRMVSSLGSYMVIYKMFWFQKCIWIKQREESLSWNGWRAKSCLK